MVGSTLLDGRANMFLACPSQLFPIRKVSDLKRFVEHDFDLSLAWRGDDHGRVAYKTRVSPPAIKVTATSGRCRVDKTDRLYPHGVSELVVKVGREELK